MGAFRAQAPIVPITFGGAPSWLVPRHADVMTVFRDEDRFSSRALHELTSFPTLGRSMMGMEGEEQRKNKALASGPFRQRSVRQYVDPVLRPLCHSLIDGFVERGEADLVTDFTKRFAVGVICGLLGIPVEDEARFAQWAMALIALAYTPEAAVEASVRFTEYLRPILEQRRAAPGDDLLSTLLTSEVEGHRLDDEEVLTIVRVLFAAGSDTTYNAVGSLIHALLLYPEAMARVREDPTSRSRAVEELLRWNGPVGLLPRVCPQRVEFLGVEIPAGSSVVMGIASANRDPAVFDRPDEFDIDRDVQQSLAFGFGVHFGLGAHLARMEMEVALDVVLERLPGLKLAGDIRYVGTVLRGPERLPVVF
jgi:cytochrome P450